jgi:hypothetical protein
LQILRKREEDWRNVALSDTESAKEKQEGSGSRGNRKGKKRREEKRRGGKRGK